VNEPVRVLLADDEPAARRRIARLLSRVPEAEILGECMNGREAVEAIGTGEVDVVFLDVQMPEVDGFDVIDAVGAERMPVTVFVTAYDRYAIRAFEVHALDYLLKPFDEERFRAAWERATAELARRTGGGNRQLVALLQDLRSEQREIERKLTPEEPHLDRFMVRERGRIFFLRSSELDWVEAAGNYLRLHAGGRSHLIRETMQSLEEKLDGDRFLRIHRSTIVNLDRVAELRPASGGDYRVLLRDGTELKLSRTYRSRLDDELSTYV
jgi:two-component system LytT family response regulator